MPGRTFFAAFTASARSFTISGDEARHILTVMRGKVGDAIDVVNGQGARCRGVIRSCSARSLSVDVQQIEHAPEPPLRTIIAPSLSRSHNTHWMLEMLAEIGVDQIRPIICERTETNRRMAAHVSAEKWRKIAIQALKVNRRLYLTDIRPPQEMGSLLADVAELPGKYFLDTEGDRQSKKKWRFPAVVLIGPPGDFSPGEKLRLQESGFVGVRINEAIMKTETAAVSIAAIMQYD